MNIHLMKWTKYRMKLVTVVSLICSASFCLNRRLIPARLHSATDGFFQKNDLSYTKRERTTRGDKRLHRLNGGTAFLAELQALQLFLADVWYCGKRAASLEFYLQKNNSDLKLQCFWSEKSQFSVMLCCVPEQSSGAGMFLDTITVFALKPECSRSGGGAVLPPNGGWQRDTPNLLMQKTKQKKNRTGRDAAQLCSAVYAVHTLFYALFLLFTFINCSLLNWHTQQWSKSP